MKLFNKVAAIAVGVALATGVGAGIVLGTKAQEVAPANATSAQWELVTAAPSDWSGEYILCNGTSGTVKMMDGSSFSSSSCAGVDVTVSNSKITADDSDAITIAKSSTNGKYTVVVNGKYIGKNANSNGIDAADTWTTNLDNAISYSSGKVVIAGNGGRVLTWYASNSNFRYYASSNNSTQLFKRIAGAATVSSVSLTGNMTTKSYTTVQHWSNAGLTATVNMSDSSTYVGNITWEYAPTTPAAAVIANSNEEVTGLSVTATASAGGQSGEKATTGISVSLSTVAQGLAAIPNANDEIDGVIVKGTVSYISSVDTTTYHNATYYISDDGNRTNELEIYRGKGLNNADITNTHDIQVGDVVLVYGNLKYYSGTTKEFLQGNYLLDLDRPASSNPSITITEASFTMNVGDSDVTLHATPENIPEGGSVKWVSGTPAVATINESTAVLHAVSAGSTVITAKIVDSGDQMVASDTITVTVDQPVVSIGDIIYLTADYSDTTYYLASVGSTSSTSSDDKVLFTVEAGYTSGTYSLKSGNNYLKCTGSSPYIGSGTDKDATTSFTIVNDGTNDIITSCSTTTRKVMWNYNNGSPRFGCYTSANATILYVEINKVVISDPTTLSLNTKSMNLAINEESDALTFTTDSQSAVFHWYSEDATKATVTNGVVTALVSSGTVKIYVYFDTNGNGQFDLGTDLSDYCTVTLTLPVVDYSSVTYGGIGTLVSSLGDLSAGDKIAITNEDDDALAGTTIVSNTIRLSEASFSITNNKLVIGDGTQEIDALILKVDTYNNSTGDITLKSGDKWLSSTGAKKANFADTAFTWTLSFDSSTTVLTSSNENGGTMQYNYNGGTDPRFIPYASSQTPIHIWNVAEYVDEAEDYASDFMNSGLCGANDNTKADSSIWMAQRTAFLTLSTGAQNVLKTATENASSPDAIQECLARYDRVIYLHYGSEPEAYPDFMDRIANHYVTPMSNTRGINGFEENSTAAAMVVVVTSAISVTAIGGFFLLKKKPF